MKKIIQKACLLASVALTSACSVTVGDNNGGGHQVGWNNMNLNPPGQVYTYNLCEILLDQSGYIYAAGSSIYGGGVWTYTSGTWGLVGGRDISGRLTAMTMDNNGTLYTGGRNSFIVGVSLVHKYVNNEWVAVGDSVPMIQINSIAVDNAGDIYVSGQAPSGLSGAIYKYANGSWVELTGVVNNVVNVPTIAIDHNTNKLYAGALHYNYRSPEDQISSLWECSAESCASIVDIPDMTYVNEIMIDSNSNMYLAGEGLVPGSGVVSEYHNESFTQIGNNLGVPIKSITMNGAGNLYIGGNYHSESGLMYQYTSGVWNQIGGVIGSSVVSVAVSSSGVPYAAGNTADIGSIVWVYQ